ncbi:molybdopterin synthase subunit MoaD [Chthonomonas calidirosea]|uniref:Molybdopterin synthase subunit MoaD n=1 Tax=Chthonomonas calidirosea (strain DSM 23976 / ICMP 18418 / T49) TaxID=1303518 RepID=S0EUV3_CHTCT|nr:MoaD/ThiS family protein [Chthonomonas calidirosea]CCW35460.1 molybdopterin synthase subunit MoaD [Chthonomonas calidirosea T49]CEK19224.1 molybdopterin synthase subunit MoaD [Chthonomonas calidirosea]CEK19225.1 molybdopterin synthase subunit MoaD [Chthonomonas calidirosea]CEK20211.1 molybdopterin synthase subunit MoaD [Chthonomonas calidirosea]
MPVTVLIPTPLRRYTGDVDTVTAAPGTIATLIEDLERQFPGISERLVDENGEIRRFVNIYVNEEDVRFLKGKDTPVKDGDSVSIVPAIAGG